MSRIFWACVIVLFSLSGVQRPSTGQTDNGPQKRLQISDIDPRWFARPSERSAEFVGVRGTPHRNPANEKLFVSEMASDMLGYSLQVWELTQAQWRKVYECRDLTYGAEFVSWHDPQTVDLEAPASEGAKKRFQLSATNGVWKSNACLN